MVLFFKNFPLLIKALSGKKVTEHSAATQLRNNWKIRVEKKNPPTTKLPVASFSLITMWIAIHSFIYVPLYPHEWLLLWVLLSKSHIAKLPRRFNVRQREKEREGVLSHVHLFPFKRRPLDRSEVRVGVLVACRAQVSSGRRKSGGGGGGWLKREKYSWLPQPPIPTLSFQ